MSKKINVEAFTGLAVGATLIGVFGKMLGLFGNDKVSKKDLLKGMADLIIDSYEDKISKLETENYNLGKEITSLKKKILDNEKPQEKKGSKKNGKK